MTHTDLEALKAKLYDWHSMIKNRQIDEALLRMTELEKEVDASLEPEIECMFELFKVRLMMLQNKYDDAKLLLDKLSLVKSIFSNEINYYYTPSLIHFPSSSSSNKSR